VGSLLAERSVVDLALRMRTGALVVGVFRDGVLIQAPNPREAFRLGDVVYFVGTTESVEKTLELLGQGQPASYA
jgi:K+/H+ antiporter YhaU regulatory subunit KhtT